MTRKFLWAMFSALLLSLCSCFSRSAQVSDFGKSLKTVYEQADDGSEYLTIYADMVYNSALAMPKLCFSAKLDTIHIDATLELVKDRKSSLTFPWRIPVPKSINRITFGPENEILWQRNSCEI